MKNNVVIAMVAVAWLAGVAVTAEGPAAQPFVEAPKIGDEVLDGAMVKVAKQTELAVVQIGKFKELAAKVAKEGDEAGAKLAGEVKALQGQVDEAQKKSPDAADTKALADKLASAKQELDLAKWNRRERLSWTIADMLYPDQLDIFFAAYEEQLGSPAGEVRKMARLRLKTVMGYELPPLELAQQADVMWALIKYYMQVNKDQAALDATFKDRASDKKAAAEHHEKSDALVRQARAKSIEIVKGLFTPEQQKALDGEWLRIQNRRANTALRTLSRQFVPKTDDQKKKVEEVSEAFRKASRTLDIDAPEYPELVTKLEKDIQAAVGQ
jgi:hypothetical protein